MSTLEGGCNLTIVRYNYARMGLPFLTVPPLFVLLLADTVAAHQLGGFKMPSGAFRKCRDCNATQNLMDSKVSHALTIELIFYTH